VSLVQTASQPTQRRPAFREELNGLLDLAQGFDRMLAPEPSYRELLDSFRLVLQRARQVEALVLQPATPIDLRRRWRETRDRINAVSDVFGLPRVIQLVAGGQPPTRANPPLAARVDQALAELDRFLDDAAPELQQTAEGSRFQTRAGGLRLKLLSFRQRALAGEPVEQLSLHLREIEVMSRQLAETARTLRVRPGAGLPGFQNPARTISQLRDLLPGSR
jgi:hypothetical protein